jgi:predicted Fe-S protein YdhL (DUF1289 family)
MNSRRSHRPHRKSFGCQRTVGEVIRWTEEEEEDETRLHR